MRRDIGLAVLLRGGAAVSWLGYVWVLTRVLSFEALGTVLYALALSGLIAGVLAAGWVGRLLRDGARAAAELDEATFRAILGRALFAVIGFGIAATAILTVASEIGFLPTLMPAWPVAVLTGAVAILTAIIACLAAAQRARGALVRALAVQGLGRAVLPLAVTAALAHQLQFRPDIVLGLFLVALFALVTFLLPGLPRPRFAGRAAACAGTAAALWKAQAGGILFQNLDVLVMGWMLGPRDAGAYLIARRLAGFLTVLFEALRSALAPRLAVAFAQPELFAALSARVNLGFLLFGAGGTGLLVLAGPFLLSLFGTEFRTAYPIFLWLVLGQAAPAIFGATGMLMVMTDMEVPRARLVWAICPVVLGLMFWAASYGTAMLAMAAALSQLFLGGTSAVLLASRHGVLPGATALLHTRLRLT